MCMSLNASVHCFLVCLRVWKGGSKCLLIVGQVSHLDASSCDGNRNGQKSETDTANGSLKLGGMVTSVALSFSLSLCVAHRSALIFTLSQSFTLSSFGFHTMCPSFFQSSEMWPKVLHSANWNTTYRSINIILQDSRITTIKQNKY